MGEFFRAINSAKCGMMELKTSDIKDIPTKFREYTKYGDEEKATYKYHKKVATMKIITFSDSVIISLFSDAKEIMITSFDGKYSFNLDSLVNTIKNKMFDASTL